MLFSLSLCVWYVHFEGCVYSFDTSLDDSWLCACATGQYIMCVHVYYQKALSLCQ